MKRSLFGIALALAAVGAGWLALTSLAPGSAVATWAPCPRNWGWGPAWQPRASPLESLAVPLGDGHAKVCYGSPALRGRTMIGGAPVPYGRLWRTGANEPTTLHLDRPARLGAITLAAGSYSLYTVPAPERWELIVNRSTRQWGLESEYTEEVARQEIGSFPVAVEPLATPVERFTIRAIGAGAGGVELLFEWQTTRLRVPLTAGTEPP